VFICLVLNAITFTIFIFTGGKQDTRELFSFKNLFTLSLVLTVLALAFINVETSWKVGKGFYYKRQYVLLLGQLVIAAAIIAIAGCILFYLLSSIFRFKIL
jgi:hypothetical protein